MSSEPRPRESPNSRHPNLITRRSSSGLPLGDISMVRLAHLKSQQSSRRSRMAIKSRGCIASYPPTCFELADAINVETYYGVPVSGARVSSAHDIQFLPYIILSDCHFACHSRCGVLVKGVCRHTDAPDELAGEITFMRTSYIPFHRFGPLTRVCSSVYVWA